MMGFRIVLWEFLLLIASILVFRSVWTLLDRIPEMNSESGIWASLIAGIVVTFTAILMINKCAEHKA